jgi:hypothetical protein
VKFVKKLSLGIINLALIGAVAWYAYQAFDEYINNPWTRDGQVRGHVVPDPRKSSMTACRKFLRKTRAQSPRKTLTDAKRITCNP